MESWVPWGLENIDSLAPWVSLACWSRDGRAKSSVTCEQSHASSLLPAFTPSLLQAKVFAVFGLPILMVMRQNCDIAQGFHLPAPCRASHTNMRLRQFIPMLTYKREHPTLSVAPPGSHKIILSNKMSTVINKIGKEIWINLCTGRDLF